MSEFDELPKIQCDIHQDRKIDFFCTNKECRKPRLGCFKCIQDNHREHLNNISEFSDINEEIQKCQEKVDIIINKIDDFVNKAFHYILDIKEQLVKQKKVFLSFPKIYTRSGINSLIAEMVYCQEGIYQERMNKVTNYVNKMTIPIEEANKLFENPQPQNFVDEAAAQQDIQLIIASLAKEIGELFNQYRFNECLAIADNALKMSPDNKDILMIKGKIHSNIREYQQAIQAFERVITKHPQHQDAKQCQIRGYISMTNFDKAQELSEKYCIQHPKTLEFIQLNGQCLFAQGKEAEAYTLFLKLDENIDMALDPVNKYYLGNCLEKMGQHLMAISYWHEALQLGYEDQQKIINLNEQAYRNI